MLQRADYGNNYDFSWKTIVEHHFEGCLAFYFPTLRAAIERQVAPRFGARMTANFECTLRLDFPTVKLLDYKDEAQLREALQFVSVVNLIDAMVKFLTTL